MFNNELEALESLYNMFIQQNENMNVKLDNMMYSVDCITNVLNSMYMSIFMPVYVLLGIWFLTWLLFKIFKD